MSHNYDVIGSGNCENRNLRPKFSWSEFLLVFFSNLHIVGVSLIQKKEMFKRCIQQCDRVEAFNTSKRKKRLDEMIEEYENM